MDRIGSHFLKNADAVDSRRLCVYFLWAWAGLYVLNQFGYELFRERTTREDARLLLAHVCSLDRARGDLVQCDAAHGVLSRGPLILAALENTLSALFRDTWRSACREFASTVRAMALFAAALAAGYAGVQYYTTRKMHDAYAKHVSSPALFHKESFAVEFQDFDLPRKRIPSIKLD
jgi:hypothetical protein